MVKLCRKQMLIYSCESFVEIDEEIKNMSIETLSGLLQSGIKEELGYGTRKNKTFFYI